MTITFEVQIDPEFVKQYLEDHGDPSAQQILTEFSPKQQARLYQIFKRFAERVEVVSGAYTRRDMYINQEKYREIA